MRVETELIRACRKGDRKAQSRLYEVCYSPLMQVCARYYNNEEDARATLNKGFLKILDNLDRYRPEVPFLAWIRRIMVNCVIDQFRRNKNYKAQMEMVDFQDHSAPAPTELNEAEKQYDAAELRAMILNLPVGAQKVFNLFVIDGFSHEEIGKMLGISEGTSRWHLANARKELRAQLKKSLTPPKPINV